MNWDAPAFYQILKTPNTTFKGAAGFISTYLSLEHPTPLSNSNRTYRSIPSYLPFSGSAVHTLSTPHPQRQKVI